MHSLPLHPAHSVSLPAAQVLPCGQSPAVARGWVLGSFSPLPRLLWSPSQPLLPQPKDKLKP